MKVGSTRLGMQRSGKVKQLFVNSPVAKVRVMNSKPEEERILEPNSLLYLLASGLYPYRGFLHRQLHGFSMAADIIYVFLLLQMSPVTYLKSYCTQLHTAHFRLGML